MLEIAKMSLDRPLKPLEKDKGCSSEINISLCRQCAVFGCINYEYNAGGTRSGLHFFGFLAK